MDYTHRHLVRQWCHLVRQQWHLLGADFTRGSEAMPEHIPEVETRWRANEAPQTAHLNTGQRTGKKDDADSEPQAHVNSTYSSGAKSVFQFSGSEQISQERGAL